MMKTYTYKKLKKGAFDIPAHLTVYDSSGRDVTKIQKEANKHYNKNKK